MPIRQWANAHLSFMKEFTEAGGADTDFSGIIRYLKGSK
jgi:hypothetical protein